ncbi:unnamed protein product [Hydatigera taeniaeformis]|uniref:WD_REPEATS_REGION domain-containing protein n=1 Tax=Hydatigena taeniaeformis TaxID=6205 RepID=A0A0R3X835_HYDTA|nr:unnamed protein product [Hydatigera taeniaeformis]
MSRRHLESALLASALVENGLSSVFRLTRIRFQRTLYPPEYQPTAELGLNNDPDRPACSHCGIQCSCRSACKKEPQVMKKCHETSVVEEDDFGVHTLRFSADGRQLIAGSANTSVRVISVVDGQQQLVLRPSSWKLDMPITCLRYLPNTLQWVLGCTPQGDIFCLDSNHEGFETLITEENQQTYCFDIASDGMQLATAGTDTSIRLYSLHIGQQGRFEMHYSTDSDPLNERRPKFGKSKTLRCPLHPYKHSSGRGQRRARRTLSTHRYESSLKCEFSLCHSTEERDLFTQIEPCKRIVGSKGDVSIKPLIMPMSFGGDTKSDKVDGTKCGTQILGYRPTGPADNYTEGHSMRITALRYHPTQPRLLISASWDHHVKVGAEICFILQQRSSFQALAIWDLRYVDTTEASVRGSDLFSGEVENTLRKQAYMQPSERIDVMEVVKGQCTDAGGGEYLYAARLLPSRAVVCGGSGFNDVRVFNRDTKMAVIRIPTDSVVQTIDSVLEGRFVAAGCTSGSITIAGLA